MHATLASDPVESTGARRGIGTFVSSEGHRADTLTNGPHRLKTLPMVEECRSRVRNVVLEVSAAAARAPVVIGYTVVGAGLVVGRGLLRLVSSLLPFGGGEASTPRHDAKRVRERAIAAERAARASGLLFPRNR